MRWAGPARWTGPTRCDDFLLTLIWNLLSHFNRKRLLCSWKKRLSGFKFLSTFDNKQWRKTVKKTNLAKCWLIHAEKTFFNYLTNVWKKKNWLQKTLSHLTVLSHLWEFIQKIFILHRWDPSKCHRIWPFLSFQYARSYFSISLDVEISCTMGFTSHLAVIASPWPLLPKYRGSISLIQRYI